MKRFLPLATLHSIFVFLLSLGLWNGCTPKTTTSIITDELKQEIDKDTIERLVRCITFDDLSGYERETAMTAYVLYKDQIKINRFEEALPLWRQAFQMAPASNGRVKYQFDDGVKLYKYLLEKEQDSQKKKLYVDSIYMLYEKRAYCFGDSAYVEGLKGFDGYYSFSNFFDTTTIFTWFTNHIDQLGLQSEYFVVNPFSKMLYDGVISGSIPRGKGLHYAKLIMDIVANGVQNCQEKQCETWSIIEAYAPVQMELLEGVDNFYDCAYYKDKYLNLYQKFPDSCDIINTAYSRLSLGGCDPQGSALKELAEVKKLKCYVAPEAPGLVRQGYDAYQEGKYKIAVQKFELFAQDAKDPEVKAKYYLLISKIYYGDLKNFSKSRTYALKAADFKTNWGEPYMLIGKLYASSGPLCGSGTGWDSQIVTWVAIDQFQYAKTIDPSLTSEANKWITQYSQYMPKTEDLFFRSIKKGSRYFVPCWIQEETTVRTSD
ncbi:MAG: hypothetical protein WAT79_02070 [Saprospiraceae bacterium]